MVISQCKLLLWEFVFGMQKHSLLSDLHILQMSHLWEEVSQQPVRVNPPPSMMCGLWPAPLFKQPLPSPLHWTLSYLQIWLFGSVAPKKHCCHSVLQGAFIGVIRVMTEEDGSRTLGEDTHGAYLTQPANSASTWNSPACSHGNKETGSSGWQCCFSVSLADAFGAAHSLNDGSPTRPLNTSHTMSLYHDG